MQTLLPEAEEHKWVYRKRYINRYDLMKFTEAEIYPSIEVL